MKSRCKGVLRRHRSPVLARRGCRLRLKDEENLLRQIQLALLAALQGVRE
ncbi:MAG: hypothetical protein HY924_00165 [Elusimicrobia bacterium]|nr:hypothetical protein [Elusimicrobiota bacterium]